MKSSNPFEGPKKLFGTSGVRGVVGREITPELFIALGRAVATQVGGSEAVAIGRDTRVSGEMLEGALVCGLLSGGCDVKLLGVVPTPAVSFAVEKIEARAGAMITASHNPPEYNGLKLFDSKGWAYTPKAEEEIERICWKKEMSVAGWNGIGRVENAEVLQDYMEKISSSVEVKREFSVVVDCGNGATSDVTPKLLREMGCRVVSINCQADGRFPGRAPEPAEENLGELCATVRGIGADIGIAHDGDGDRVVAVDEMGRVVGGDELLALMAAEEIKKGDVIVTTVDASRVVDDVVGERGGTIVRTGVGDVSVAVAIRERNAIFGGEPCGAWIFPRLSHSPDGPLGAAKILELVSREQKRLSEIIGRLPKYWMVRKKTPCQREVAGEILKKAEEELVEKIGAMEVLKIDGLRAETEDGWVLVRPSGTEPCIRITAEGRTREIAEGLASMAVEILKKHG